MDHAPPDNPVLRAPLDTPVLRFAPSPNGALHLGHARSAILNDWAAQRSGGRLLLRMEDIDLGRCTPDLERGVRDDLDWLGIRFDGPVRRQSEHFPVYRRALEKLRAMGLTYPAFTTRGELRALVAQAEAEGRPWPRDPDGAPLPPPTERLRGESERRRLVMQGRPFAWRLDMQAALARLGGEKMVWRESPAPLTAPAEVTFEGRLWGDVVLARRDTPTSYHLSVVVDDAVQQVTHVIRGRDLYAATAVHRILQRLLDLPEPVYHHHALVLDEDGRKLSKSIGSTAIAARRKAGLSAAETCRLALEMVEPIKTLTLPGTTG